jgi:glycosyltransferase involved in cell wall biosynthesis
MLIHGAVDNDIHPPRAGGTQRSFGIYRGLARGHGVRVLCVVPNRNRAAREEVVAGVTLVRRGAWYTSAAWRLEQAGLMPMFVAAYGHRASAGRLLEALSGQADVLAADLNLIGLLEARPARLRVYTAHNVEYDHFRMVKCGVVAAAAWARGIRRLEARAVEGSDLTVACSDEDAARMGELYGARGERVVVIPNGFDETRVRPPEGEERACARAALGIGEHEYVSLFLGSDTLFNREGLARLTGAFPALASAAFRLIVVGGVTRVLGNRREPWLITHGETDQLAPFLHAADAGLNPVTTGGGSNVKLPTYLGAGLAAVTTEFGLRGYAALRPWTILAEPDRIAEALRERPPGWRARGLDCPPVIQDYAWGRLGERLGGMFAARLARGPAGAAPAGPQSARSGAGGLEAPEARAAGGKRS